MNDSPDHISWPPPYKVTKHRRARRVKLRASRQHGLEITVPYRFNQKELPYILEENKQWIMKQMVQFQLHLATALPTCFELRAIDEAWAIHYVESDTKLQIIERPQREIVVLSNEGHDLTSKQEKLTDWIKQRAKQHLPLQLDLLSRDMQLGYEKVIVRDQKTQWGSCTVNKSIQLNYRLIFLPLALVRHIMVHELCHTVYLNHSKKFWDLVAKHDSDWMENKKAIRYADKYLPAGF